MEWLPTSGYEYAKAPDIEAYLDNGTADIWVPVRKI
jgi:AraC family transcriptional regulator